jgi:hypothetical protein
MRRLGAFAGGGAGADTFMMPKRLRLSALCPGSRSSQIALDCCRSLVPPNADLVAVEEVPVAANDDLSRADVSLADFAGKRFKAAPITQLHFCLCTRPSKQLKGWSGACRRCNLMHPPRDP